MFRMSGNHPYRLPRVPRLPLLGAVVLLALGTLSAPAQAAGESSATKAVPGAGPSAALPVVTPTPQSMKSAGRDLRVPDRVRLVIGDDVDASSVDAIKRALASAGAGHIDTTAAGGSAPASDSPSAAEPSTSPGTGRDGSGTGETDSAGPSDSADAEHEQDGLLGGNTGGLLDPPQESGQSSTPPPTGSATRPPAPDVTLPPLLPGLLPGLGIDAEDLE